jgi:hypothetical protein
MVETLPEQNALQHGKAFLPGHGFGVGFHPPANRFASAI